MISRPLSRGNALRTTEEFMDALDVPPNLRADVLDAYSKMFPRPEDGVVTFGSQVAVSIACLLMILEIERPECAGHAEYMRLRNIAQMMISKWLEPKGHASQFGGEPEFYGTINALLIKLFKVYGEDESGEAKGN